MALAEKTDRFHDLALLRDHGAGKKVLHQRPHLGKHTAHANSREEDRPDRRLDGLASLDRCRQRRAVIGFGAKHSDARLQRAHRRGDPGREPAAPERNEYCVDLGKLLVDLEPHRSIAGENVAIRHGMHEQSALVRMSVIADDAPPFRIRQIADPRAEPLQPGHLGGGSALRQQHRRGNPERAGDKRDALSHVAGAHRVHTASTVSSIR